MSMWVRVHVYAAWVCTSEALVHGMKVARVRVYECMCVCVCVNECMCVCM